MGIAELVPGLELWMEIIVAIVCSIFAMLASSSGIGGGIIFVSMLQIFGVSPHVAAPLSKAMIFCGSTTLSLLNLFQHEAGDPEKPAILWDFVFIIEPAAVAGALIGAMINVVLPEWLLLSVEIIFLIYMVQKMMRSSIQILNKERVVAGRSPVCGKCTKRKDGGSTEECDVSKSASVQPAVANNDVDDSSDVGSVSSDKQPLIDDEHKDKQAPNTTKKPDRCNTFGIRHFKAISLARLINFLVCTALVIAFEVITQIFPGCSTLYWVSFTVSFVFSLLGVIINVALIKRSLRVYTQYLNASRAVNGFLNEEGDTELERSTSAVSQKQQQQQESNMIEQAAGDSVTGSFISSKATDCDADGRETVDAGGKGQVSDSEVHQEAARRAKIAISLSSPQALMGIKFYIKFTLIGLVAGILGALLGIGGGLLKNPILISFGIDPEQARTASAVMIAFTSLSSMISYIIVGGLRLEYAWPLMLVVGVFFVSGYYLSNIVIACLRTKSLIPFLITVFVMISLCFIIVNTATVFTDIVREGSLPGFNNLC